MLQLEQYTGLDYRQILEKAMDFVSNVKCFNYTLGDHHQAIPLDHNYQIVIKMLHSRALIHENYKNPCLAHIPHPHALWIVSVAWAQYVLYTL